MLGCARHTAALYDRGGMTRIGPLDTVTAVDWGRTRDDMSMGHVTLQGLSEECASLLANAEPNRHELVIFRDEQRVWEGPVSLIKYSGTQVDIEARDVLYYLYKLIRRIPFDYSDISIPMVQHIKNVLVGDLDRRENEDPPINVRPFFTAYLSAHTVHTSRKKPAYSNTVFEEIDDIARYAGVDYTVVGRAILASDVHTVFFQTPPVSEADFMGPVVVTAYGLQHATYAAVTDGEGLYGDSGGPDPYYGHWEELITATNEDGEATAEPDVFPKMAKSALVGKNPVPFVVSLPDGTQLNPNGTLSIDDLVPGARIPLRATMTARTFSMMQKLDSMKVTESAGTAEKITVNMSTASIHDEPMTGVLP